jgi:RNA polymerase sigma-70 factor (ECF subfamily)
MVQVAPSDEDLLAGHDPATFELFYERHVDGVLGFFARRTRDAELAADLTAETFAAALVARRRFRPDAGAAGAWLFGIAFKKLADAQRRGYAERRACRRLGMERLELSDEDIARIDMLAEDTTASELLDQLGEDQQRAIRAYVVDERTYAEIAADEHVSEAVVRKRVSRGLAAVRARMGARR